MRVPPHIFLDFFNMNFTKFRIFLFPPLMLIPGVRVIYLFIYLLSFSFTVLPHAYIYKISFSDLQFKSLVI